MKERVFQITNEIFTELEVLSKWIYENPELGNQEFLACEKHTELLKKYKFNVENNYLNIKTAFKAVYDSGKPGITVAFLAEYDALPKIGHGCGHNILGTTSTGAGIILSKVINEIGGKIIVFGTPAEETNGAKVVMAEMGAFNEVDIALVAHPENRYYKSGRSLAMEALQFEFFGHSAHAAANPDKGVNALDAVIGLFNNINALRQHVRGDARIHGVIDNGGVVPNIVPDYASAKFYVRATTKTYLDELVEKVKNCGKASAIATGCEVKYFNYESSYHNMVTNEALSEVFTRKLMESGCKKIYQPRESFGSIDAGNVSHVCPTIHPYFDINGDENIIAHTKEFADSSVMPYANEQMRITINAMVLTAVEVMKDNELFKAIKKEFEEAEK